MIDEIKLTSLSGRGSVVMKARDYAGYWLGPGPGPASDL